MWNFYTVLLQIHSGNCLQKIGILDLSLIKLLQNEQGCNFFASQCRLRWCRKAFFRQGASNNGGMEKTSYFRAEVRRYLENVMK